MLNSGEENEFGFEFLRGRGGGGGWEKSRVSEIGIALRIKATFSDALGVA